jgi:hypothetical protein
MECVRSFSLKDNSQFAHLLPVDCDSASFQTCQNGQCKLRGQISHLSELCTWRNGAGGGAVNDGVHFALRAPLECLILLGAQHILI